MQIDKAKENGLESAYVQDIQALDDELVSELLAKHGQFDKVFSNAVLHWCKRDPAGVIRGVKKVLKPGGLFAAEFGGWGNCIGEINRLSARNRVSQYTYRRSLCAAFGVAQEGVRPHREGSLVFPIDGILLKGTTFSSLSLLRILC